MSPRMRFVCWFVLTTFLHALGTVGACIYAFAVGMSAFTTGSGDGGNWLLGLWTPPAMYFWESTGRSIGEGWLLLLGIGWSAVIGVAGGFLIPWLFPGKKDGSPVPSFEGDAAGMSRPAGPAHSPGGKGRMTAHQKELALLVSFPLVIAGITVLSIWLDIKKYPGGLGLWFPLVIMASAFFLIPYCDLEVKRKARNRSSKEWFRIFMGCVLKMALSAILMVILLIFIFLCLV